MAAGEAAVVQRTPDMTLTRVRRASAVSLGLLVTGAVTGAAVGVGVLEVWGVLADGPGGFPYVWFAFEFAAVAGALLGGVLLPLISWTVLRHVSFGRILGETSVGTVIGAALAILSDGMGNPFVAVAGGLLGFAASVVRMRLRHPRGQVLVSRSADVEVRHRR